MWPECRSWQTAPAPTQANRPRIDNWSFYIRLFCKTRLDLVAITANNGFLMVGKRWEEPARPGSPHDLVPCTTWFPVICARLLIKCGGLPRTTTRKSGTDHRAFQKCLIAVDLLERLSECVCIRNQPICHLYRSFLFKGNSITKLKSLRKNFHKMTL